MSRNTPHVCDPQKWDDYNSLPPLFSLSLSLSLPLSLSLCFSLYLHIGLCTPAICQGIPAVKSPLDMRMHIPMHIWMCIYLSTYLSLCASWNSGSLFESGASDDEAALPGNLPQTCKPERDPLKEGSYSDCVSVYSSGIPLQAGMDP